MNPGPGGSTRTRFLGVVGIALLLRVAVALPGLDDAAERFARPDTAHYLESARALAEEGRYLEAPGSDRPAVVRGPGFPLLLAPFLALGLDEAGLALVLCLVGALGTGFVYLAGRELGSERTAVLAGLLLAGNLTAVAASPLLLSDTWFATLVAAELWLAARLHRGGGLRDLVLLALIAGFAALVRPVGLPWVAGLVLLVLFRPGPAGRRRVGEVLLAVALFSAVTVPWMARNQANGGGFRLDTAAGHSLLAHVASVVLAREEGGDPEPIRERLLAETDSVFAADPARYATEGPRDDLRRERAFEVFRRYPGATISLTVQPMILAPDVTTLLELLGLTRGGKGTMDVLQTQGVVAAVRHYFGDRVWLLGAVAPLLLVVVVLYLAAGLRVLLGAVRREGLLLLFFLVFCVAFVFPNPLPVARYQLPALPFLCVLAGTLLAAFPRVRNVPRMFPGG